MYATKHEYAAAAASHGNICGHYKRFSWATPIQLNQLQKMT
jgi:hypothetical protein